MLMQIRNNSSALDQGAHENNSRKQVPLPNKLSNAEGKVDALWDDLTSCFLEIGEGVRVFMRESRYLSVSLQTRQDHLVKTEDRLPA